MATDLSRCPLYLLNSSSKNPSGGSLVQPEQGSVYGSYLYWNADSASGKWVNEPASVHLGINAGRYFQGGSAVALGAYAGQSNQGNSAVAIGLERPRPNRPKTGGWWRTAWGDPRFHGDQSPRPSRGLPTV